MSSTFQIQQELAALQGRLYALEKQLTQALPAESMPAQEIWLLLCSVGEHQVAFPLATIARVVPLAWLEPLPEAPPWVAGVLTLRGEPVPVLDVLARMERSSRAPSVDDLIVIVEHAGRPIGLVVARVLGVIAGKAEALTAGGGDVPHAPYILGAITHEQRTVHVLSVQRLVALSDIPDAQS